MSKNFQLTPKTNKEMHVMIILVNIFVEYIDFKKVLFK